jgi:hypothetical protein
MLIDRQKTENKPFYRPISVEADPADQGGLFVSPHSETAGVSLSVIQVAQETGVTSVADRRFTEVQVAGGASIYG